MLCIQALTRTFGLMLGKDIAYKQRSPPGNPTGLSNGPLTSLPRNTPRPAGGHSHTNAGDPIRSPRAGRSLILFAPTLNHKHL
jgi:hypothetical protein